MTFVDRLTLDICGEVAQHGVCLADVTGDGDSELVVATDIGDLYIYKYGERVSKASFSCLSFLISSEAGLHTFHSHRDFST